jgi:hypothetical protein
VKERISMSIVDDLMDLNKKTCHTLWNMRTVGDGQHNPGDNAPRIVFPRYRRGNARHSEQEARFIFCSHLNSMEYCYSVETPTREVYQFTSEGSRSAMSDVSLYTTTLKRIANVEFKAGHPHEKGPSIWKDIWKLAHEEGPGNWFHFLRSTNQKTVPELKQKFIRAFLKCSREHHVHIDDISIVFCIYVHQKEYALTKHFQWHESDLEGFNEYVRDFFEDNDNDWDRIERQG